jgi:hypothetical protein
MSVIDEFRRWLIFKGGEIFEFVLELVLEEVPRWRSVEQLDRLFGRGFGRHNACDFVSEPPGLLLKA